MHGEQIQALEFDYQRHADQEASLPAEHDVVIIGAGPVGLSLAIDLAQRGTARGQKILVLDNDYRLSTGSRAICFAKRTLEVWDRLGIGQVAVDKGVSWNVGRVFKGQEQVYQFDLLPEPGHERPAFINLQQYYAEAYLLGRALAFPTIEIRWKNTLESVNPTDTGVTIGVATPEGTYSLRAKYLIACDGSRSTTRRLLGLEGDYQNKGRTFHDKFLIADIRMPNSPLAQGPTERWFYFDPPFHPGLSVLLHRQPDDVWRVDFQLGWDADPQAERQPEKIKPRIDAMMRQTVGHELPFDLVWASVYTFACQRMEKFVHERVIFAGDSAHGVSPFGARGANSGVQDAENLAWKLDVVLSGQVSDAAHAKRLIESYGTEREFAADENILNSTRSTDFITPKSEISKLFRNAVLDLSREHVFARRFVNSGRLSVATVLSASPLHNDKETVSHGIGAGAVLPDAPVLAAQGKPWLLAQVELAMRSAMNPRNGSPFGLLVYAAFYMNRYRTLVRFRRGRASFSACLIALTTSQKRS